MLRASHIYLMLLGLALACESPRPACDGCSVVGVAAVREPPSVFPPLVMETVGRDISDRVYERLAEFDAHGATIDTAAFHPALAVKWERVDSLRWRFHLRPGARWHDGVPLTAGDVVFSFAAYTDTTLETAAASALDGVVAVAEDSATVVIRFPAPSPEQLYDATWHVRIIPEHIWKAIPASQWAGDSALSHLVGSGPYRMGTWDHGTSLSLDADSAWRPRPAITRLTWQFATDPETALNLVLAGDAALLEHAGGPAQVQRVTADTSLRLIRYPSAVYGFAAFRAADRSGRPDPLFGDRRVRQALTMSLDRATIATAVFGPGTTVPRGPFSRLQWIGSDEVHPLPFDTVRAAALLDSAGWVRSAGGMRHRGGAKLTVRLLVPSTSASRKLLAEALQESWRRIGVDAAIEAVDFPVFQQRLAAGKFDVYLGAYLDEPSPRGIVDQWTRTGWSSLNYGHYDNPVTDSLIQGALAASTLNEARAAWATALDSLNIDAPAAFLYAPEQSAVASQRITGIELDPWSWLDGIERWGIRPPASSK